MSFRRLLPLAAAIVMLAAGPAAAEDPTYQTPSQVLADIVLAPPTPLVSLSPNRSVLLLLERPSLPGIAELAERELRLAGMRIKPQIDGQSRTRPYSGLAILPLSGGDSRAIAGIPDGARIENVRWSPDGSRIAFTNTTSDGLELWMADVATARATRLTGPVVSMTGNAPPKWVSDNRTIVFAMVPEGRGGEPSESAVPAGPVVQEHLGGKSPARTYQDLLKGPHDEALFQYYFTAQIAAVNADGEIRKLSEPGIVWDFDPSPDGRHLLVEMIHRPFSYLVPASRFPKRVEVWDLDGKPVALLADLPLHEGIPVAFGSVPTGQRSHGWRNDAPAEVVWAEAQDGGDAGAEAELRDKVFVLGEPFDGTPRELAALDQRFGGVTWGRDDVALVSSWWWKTRNVKTWVVQPGNPGAESALLFDYSWEDRYNDPGNPETETNAWGRRVLRFSEDGGSMFLVGDGASEEGDRPFLDRMNLASRETERLFRSEGPYYERPVELLESGRLLTRREATEEPPNYYVRDLDGDALNAVTTFPHPTPQLAGIQKELIRYQRADGVQLNGTLYLPAGYTKDQGPLPTVLWAYPQEFKSADAAGQVTDSPYRFARVGWWSPLLWLSRGYAVLDDPGMPVVGEGDEEPNETFVAQLVSSAQAAINEVARRGVTDPNRVAVGGHSYGAFMTANLLAHSDLFAAGIARSGAYNRTLTPFGFQAEERTLWEASDVYFTMSPFMHAEKVNEPLLLIHGDSDNNSGTFPMQSERFYNALKGLGATTRLVMLPHESHGYRAKESILHMLWETERWLDTYVKEKDSEDDQAAAGS